MFCKPTYRHVAGGAHTYGQTPVHMSAAQNAAQIVYDVNPLACQDSTCQTLGNVPLKLTVARPNDNANYEVVFTSGIKGQSESLNWPYMQYKGVSQSPRGLVLLDYQDSDTPQVPADQPPKLMCATYFNTAKCQLAASSDAVDPALQFRVSRRWEDGKHSEMQSAPVDWHDFQKCVTFNNCTDLSPDEKKKYECVVIPPELYPEGKKTQKYCLPKRGNGTKGQECYNTFQCALGYQCQGDGVQRPRTCQKFEKPSTVMPNGSSPCPQ